MSVTLKDFARDPGLLLIPVVPVESKLDWDDFPEEVVRRASTYPYAR